MILDTLMTDRTVGDLADDTDKAYIACTDLNRVEQACALLAGLLYADIRTKEWGTRGSRTDAEMAHSLGGTEILRVAYFIKASTPVTPAKTIYSSAYQASDIKQILKDLGDMYDNTASG